MILKFTSESMIVIFLIHAKSDPQPPSHFPHKKRLPVELRRQFRKLLESWMSLFFPTTPFDSKLKKVNMSSKSQFNGKKLLKACVESVIKNKADEEEEPATGGPQPATKEDCIRKAAEKGIIVSILCINVI